MNRLRWQTDLLSRTGWVGPFLIVVMLAGGSTLARWTSSAAVGHLQSQREAIVESLRKRLPADQFARMTVAIPAESLSLWQRTSRRMAGLAVWMFVVAGICWVVLSILFARGDVKYRDVLRVVAWSATVLVAGDVLSTALTYVTGRFVEHLFVLEPVVAATGLTGDWAVHAGDLDIVVGMWLVMIGIGLSSVFRVSKTAFVAVLLAGYIALTLAPALLPKLPEGGGRSLH